MVLRGHGGLASGAALNVLRDALECRVIRSEVICSVHSMSVCTMYTSLKVALWNSAVEVVYGCPAPKTHAATGFPVASFDYSFLQRCSKICYRVHYLKISRLRQTSTTPPYLLQSTPGRHSVPPVSVPPPPSSRLAGASTLLNRGPWPPRCLPPSRAESLPPNVRIIILQWPRRARAS